MARKPGLHVPGGLRAIVAYLARGDAAATLTQVAERLRRDPAALSHGLRRIESRAAADRDFANRLKTLNNAIMQA